MKVSALAKGLRGANEIRERRAELWGDIEGSIQEIKK
jgi:hypothetical protein